MQAAWIPSLGGKIPWRRKWQLTQVFLAWEIPRTEEPVPGLVRVRNDLVIKSPPLLQQFCTQTTILCFPFSIVFSELHEIFNTLKQVLC